MFFKKYKKFLVILILGFLILPNVFCLGANLEINYPSINGKTITKIETPLTSYFEYLFNIGMFLGFLAFIYSLITAGVYYIFSPISPETRAKAKDQIYGAISGFLVLITFYLILTTINPELKFFKLKNLPDVSVPVSSITPGVYFHTTAGCPTNDNATASTSDINDFDENLKNQIVSVNMVQKPPNESYISVLYDINDLKGKCQYIDPNTSCHTVEPFASSASVHRYDFSPRGDGVYFYRKSFYNEGGGWYKVDNFQINNIYIENLENLYFTGSSSGICNVPLLEQDCIKWEGNTCKERRCPNLAGTNISSIKINGKYIVLLIFFSNTDKNNGPWSFCQAFPTPNDANRTGPYQIKWEIIRNQNMLPNWVAIIPVKDN